MSNNIFTLIKRKGELNGRDNMEHSGDGFHFIMKNIVIINILLSLIIVFFERRSPQAVWTWLLLLYFIPIVGFILYLIIGQDYHKNKMFKAKEIEGELKYAVRRQEETIYHRQLKMTSRHLTGSGILCCIIWKWTGSSDG